MAGASSLKSQVLDGSHGMTPNEFDQRPQGSGFQSSTLQLMLFPLKNAIRGNLGKGLPEVSGSGWKGTERVQRPQDSSQAPFS
jgi:hypothetical protein